MAWSWIFVLGILGVTLQVRSKQYDNHALICIIPSNDIQLKAAILFEDPEKQIEVLKPSRGYNDSLDVLVPPDRIDYIQQYIEDNKLNYIVKSKNYGLSFELPDRTPLDRNMNDTVFHYNSFATIQKFIEGIASAHPDLVTLQTLGNSYEGREMKLVKISTNPRAKNPIIFVDAGIHALEWVAPAMALYIIQRLATDPHAKAQELYGVDWYILPVVNPDGYEYTRSDVKNRLWRKTRSRNGNCYGVDGNRNYGYKWGVSGASKDPCDREVYAGPGPFSEPETRMVKHVMTENAKRMKLYVSLHSYGQYLVYPWGYTGDFVPKTWKKLDRLAKAVSEAVVRAGGLPFTVMSGGKWYPAAGGSDDYAFGARGVPYSYTMELTNGHEFLYPANLLHGVLPQFYEGFRVFGKQIKSEFGRTETVERRKRNKHPKN